MQDNARLIKLLEKVFTDNNWIQPLTIDDLIEIECNMNLKLKEIYRSLNIPPYTIGGSTLRRLLHKDKYDKSFDIATTLNPLAKLAGYDSWGYYLKKINASDYAELLPVDIIDDAETLEIGAHVKMGWYPIRYAELEYLGDCEFKIIKYVGTGPNREGDSIIGRWFDVVDVPAGPGNLEPTQDIAGVLGDTEYDRIYL